MSERKLEYKNHPGVAHKESAWIESRRTIYGETKDQAEAELKKLVDGGQVVVVA